MEGTVTAEKLKHHTSFPHIQCTNDHSVETKCSGNNLISWAHIVPKIDVNITKMHRFQLLEDHRLQQRLVGSGESRKAGE